MIETSSGSVPCSDKGETEACLKEGQENDVPWGEHRLVPVLAAMVRQFHSGLQPQKAS